MPLAASTRALQDASTDDGSNTAPAAPKLGASVPAHVALAAASGAHNIAASAPVLALTRSSAAAPAPAALAELDPAFTSESRLERTSGLACAWFQRGWSEQRFAGAAGFPRRVPVPRACVPPRRASVHKRQLERPGEGGRPLLKSGGASRRAKSTAAINCRD
jgi:hypothetical protein